MKKINVTITITLITSLLNAQNPLVKQWDYRFGGTGIDNLTSVHLTKDKGYILGGYSWSPVSGDKTQPAWSQYADYWIIKIDSLENKQWDKRFGGTSSDNLLSVQQTSDGGYLLGGHSISDSTGDKTQQSWGNNSYDYWLVKIDSMGDKIWDKSFGGTNGDYLYSMEKTSDGGFILGGNSNSDSSGDKTQDTWGSNDYWIVKIDSLGNKQWDKDFGGTDYDIISSIQQTNDGGYILGGYSVSGIGGDKTQATWDTSALNNYRGDYWIIKIDSLGNKQWDKDFGGQSVDKLFSLQQTSDKGYIFGGYSKSGIGGDKTQSTWGGYDYWIIKIDSLGNKQWDKDFGGTSDESTKIVWGLSQVIGSIFQTFDGGYLVSSTSNSNISGDKTENNLGASQTWIVKTDSLGNKQWDKTIFTLGQDEEGLAMQTSNGCYLFVNNTAAGIGGYKAQPSWGASDYWITKFCDTTLTTSINQISDDQIPISIYPNPTKSTLNLFLNNKGNIVITNLIGEIVLHKTAEGKIELDVSFLSAGIYFIKVDNIVKKFVKE